MSLVRIRPSEFHSFEYAMYSDIILEQVVAYNLSLCFIHILKLLNCSKHVYLVTATLRRVSEYL